MERTILPEELSDNNVIKGWFNAKNLIFMSLFMSLNYWLSMIFVYGKLEIPYMIWNFFIGMYFLSPSQVNLKCSKWQSYLNTITKKQVVYKPIYRSQSKEVLDSV